MKKQDSFNHAKPGIERLFDSLPDRIITFSQLRSIFEENKTVWNLAKSMTLGEFLHFMHKGTKLKHIELTSPYRGYTKFLWGDSTIYSLALSLQRHSYLTHYTAMYLHGLTEQIPKTVYLNFEQPDKHRPTGRLEQENINRAFSSPQRISKNVITYKGQKIQILNSMHTGRLGVTEFKSSLNETLLVTDLPKTLIDITVRPNYSGGIFEVLNAYKAAKNRNVSINLLASYLKKLNYIYPYHQVIGFYMQKAGGYDTSQIDLLRSPGMDYDFYIAYGMRETEYIKEWRLHVPKGF